MKKKIFAMITLLGLAVMMVNAQTATPRANQRQKAQRARIHQGIKSGELTKQEARQLKMREAKIRHDKRVAKSDGVVTAQERAKIHREQKRASKAIARQKHDAQHK